MIKITAGKCKECNDIIYSRAKHDYRRCSCNKAMIDGGIHFIDSENYIRSTSFTELIELEMPFSTKENLTRALTKDYNYNFNQYGLIKGDKYE